MKRKITLDGKQITYDLQRKRVKNVNLRVKRDLSVNVSADPRVPIGVIEDILRQKADFILRALGKYESLTPISTEKQYASGENILIFGEEKTLFVEQGAKNSAALLGDTVRLTVKDTEDTELKRKTLRCLLDKLCEDAVTSLCKETYPKFAALGVEFPQIRFRHMKSRWGSCQYKNGVLTFNYALVRVPLSCVEYVVCHEFTHFLHPDHSAAFYKRLSDFIPDHKQRKKALEAVGIER